MQLLKALAAQGLGSLAAIFMLRLTSLTGPWAWVAFQVMAAMACSRALKQPPWWLAIHLAFAPAALLMLTLQWPSWAYFWAAVLLGLVFWGTVKGDVPLFLSSGAVTSAMKSIVAREHAQTFVDLGAGIGSVAVPLARDIPQLAVEAWERAPIPWLIARWRCHRLPNARVYRTSLWLCDLSAFDVVFAFLSPAPMPVLGEKALREMRPGSLLVSSSFAIPGWEAESILELDDRMRTRLFCYRIS